MVPAAPLTAIFASFSASLALLGLMLFLAPRLGLIAQPNERSSHSRATPTMGGLAIVVPVLGFLAAGADHEGRVMLGFLVSASLLALVGFLDDLRELGAGLRLCCQGLAVAALLFSLALPLPWVLVVMTGVALLWHINLFNFMDGIDGIAAVQTLLFCLGTQLLAGGLEGATGMLNWVIVGGTMGFLAFNWPPARIFMGDVGALVLGLVLGGLVIVYHRSGEVPFVASIILLSGFWFDASYTLCVRILTGQRFAEAHRSHLYQKVTDRLGHLGTTLLFAVLGTFWLLPLAWLSLRGPAWGAAALIAATLPYLVGAVVLKAGRADPEAP